MSVQQEPTAIRVSRAVEWYVGLPADYHDVTTLLQAADRLACRLFDFAGEVGDLYRDKNATEHRRKSEFARLFREMIAADPKPSASAAEKEADGLTMSLRDEEQQADAAYRAAWLLYESAGRVLDQMRQRISQLKSEYRAEMTGQGSQRN